MIALQGCVLLPKLEVDENYGRVTGGTGGSGGGGGTPSSGGSVGSMSGGGPTFGGTGSGGTRPSTTDGGSGNNPGDTGGKGGNSPAEPRCGDGLRASDREDCDDGNLTDGDGCSATCLIEEGFQCTDGDDSVCSPICGDGARVAEEAGAGRCDDGNATSGDGCDAACEIEEGFECDDAEPTSCRAICGDGRVRGAEAQAGGCDDRNRDDGDGCSAACTVEETFACSGEPSTCAQTCGDSTLQAGETCDDGNTKAGDGCFACSVEPGYTCTGASDCTNIDECDPSDPKHDCDANATCTDEPGTYRCECKSGFTGNGRTCQNINECTSTSNPHNCAAVGARCQDTIGSFTCECLPGYTGDGRTCTDVNECATGAAMCPANSTCDGAQPPGSYTCTCKSGFAKSGALCVDIDECATGKSDCSAAQNEKCVNTKGSYVCECIDGYTKLGDGCSPIYRMLDFEVEAVNADGTVVVGFDAAGSGRPVRWTESNNTVEYLGPQGYAYGVSGDGRVVVGIVGSGAGRARRWVQGSAAQVIGPTTDLSPKGTNADGSVVVGDAFPGPDAFFWSSSASSTIRLFVQDAGINPTSFGTAVSSDGNFVVGNVPLPMGGRGFRWNRNTGVIDTINPIGGQPDCGAADVSGDGRVVVGSATEIIGQLQVEFIPYRWVNGTATALALPSGHPGAPAQATNRDGSRVVADDIYWGSAATPSTRGVNLRELAQSLGVNVADIHSFYANDISEDGRTIVGNLYLVNSVGISRGFVLRVP